MPKCNNYHCSLRLPQLSQAPFQQHLQGHQYILECIEEQMLPSAQS